MFAFGVALMNTTFPKSVIVMSHKKSRGMKYAKVLTTGRVIGMLDYSCNPVYTKMYVNFYHRNAVVKSKTRHLYVETLYEISLCGQIQKAVDYQARPVRVRILKDSSRDPNKDLIFHVHGGCFMKTTPEAHEIYLKDWITQMKGTTVLAVDYAKDKFPRGLQDVLDVYLWLTNSDEGAKKVLGFVPQRILFTGDSAGANLSLALTLILNDLRGMETSLKIQMPVGILGIYGVYNLLPVMSPARIISAIDPILQQAVTLSVLAFYCGDNEPLIGERHESQSRLHSTKNSPWFYGSRHYVHSNFERMTKLVRSPYVSPVFYEKFEELSEIPLCLATTHFCPLLDDSVLLAKIWKGPVLLDVMDGLSHAFMNYIDQSKEAKRANDKCVQRMKEMLADKHSEANGFHEIRL